MMNLESMLLAAGISAYSLASVLAVLGLVRPTSHGNRWMLGFMVLGAASLLGVLGMRALHSGHAHAVGRFEAFTVYGVFVSLMFLAVCWRRRRVSGLAAILVPYVTLALILGLPALHAPQAVISENLKTVWLEIHIATAFLGYACFSLAGIMAVAYLVQDRNLKRGHIGAMMERLPPLETLDRLMSVQVGIAFLMLTVSIMLGVLLVWLSGGGEEWVWDPKVVATIATWCIFALLVHMRRGVYRHGRRVAFVVIMGLICLLFAFVGVHVVAHSAHEYLVATEK